MDTSDPYLSEQIFYKSHENCTTCEFPWNIVCVCNASEEQIQQIAGSAFWSIKPHTNNV